MSSTVSPPLPTLDDLATALLLLDPQRRILFVNAAAEHLFDLSRSKLLGASIDQYLPALSPTLDAVARDRWHYTTSDLPLTRPDGSQWRLETTVTPWRDGYLLELRAIDRARATHELEARERLHHALQTMSRTIAHEIKNPLGGIRGAAQLLALELDGTPLADHADLIVREADRLHALLTRLTDRVAQPRLTPGNLHEPLERARNLILAEHPDLTIERDYDVSIPPLLIDRERLVQLFLNLLKNAAEALRGRGTVRLMTRIERHLTLGKKRWPLAAHIAIIDNGPGIPPELQPHLFYPLVSGRPGGSGLGLAVAREIALEHQGILTFTTRPGETIFHCYLPIPDRLPAS
ncbi:MAG: nitrogen regulation protein NR(II) [Hydrogenophilus sp.]|nr:nitrogen regulation protein NR(II) [Hydrogenophilus sp.]